MMRNMEMWSTIYKHLNGKLISNVPRTREYSQNDLFSMKL